MKKTLLFSLVYFVCQFSSAQLMPEFIGSAVDLGNNCYIITPDALSQVGGVFYDNPIDFDTDFAVYFQVNLGNKDGNGADGMAMVFKSDANADTGGDGGGLAYEGISPSLIVEFDTYQNLGDNGDPAEDHIAILRDGIPRHFETTNLAGPVQASSTNPNIEDGIQHDVKIQWVASTQTFTVFFDCVQRLQLTAYDIKTDIFSGDDTVFFGFVASTGGLSNLHEVCFNNITFVENLVLEDTTICENSSVNVDATIPSGVTYSWLPTTGVSDPNIPNPEISPLTTTTYTVTIEDVCGEQFTEDITVTVETIVIPAFDAVNPICSGDALAALPTTSNNGVTGTWSPALDNTATTTYTFTPDAAFACAETVTLEIVVNPIITPVFDAVAPICEGDPLSPLPTTSINGVTGVWLPALDNTTTTTYTFTPDAGQCAVTETLTITVNPLVNPTFDSVADICTGDTLTALPTTSNNGITGTWSPALDNTTTTTYTFTPDNGQCALTETLTINVEPIVTPVFDSVADICSGDALTVLPTTSNNGVTGTWSPALDNTATTTYTFTPDAAFPCAEVVTLEIIVNPTVVPEFDGVGPICDGDTLAPLPTTSNNGVTGTWSPALDNTTTTTYTFTPDAGQICTPSVTLEIIVNPILDATFDPVAPICAGDSLPPLPTTSNNGIDGTWSPAINTMATTTYTFTPNGPCANTTSLEIIVDPLIISEFDPILPLCPGETLAPLPTTSNNGITGTWSPAINNNETTTYTFTPDAGQGCSVEAMLTVEVLDGQTPTFNIQESICEGDTPLILPTVSEEGITGSWSPTFNNLQTTEYTFTPDPNQCAEINTYTVAVLPIEQLSLSISFESTPFDGNQSIVVNVTGGTGDYEYQLDNRPWTISNVFTQISGCEDHIISVREASGCSNVATEVFRVFDFPKFFTPNGDTDNDYWNIKCLTNQSNSLISIFNRYGKLLKQISPISSGWDGTYNGNPLPSDDYWFSVEYTDDDGVIRSFSSHFALKL